MNITYTELVAVAERRLHHDAAFHARVHRSIEAVETMLPVGRRLNGFETDLVSLAAACGVVMADRDPT